MNGIAIDGGSAAAQVGEANAELVGIAIAQGHVPEAHGCPCRGRGRGTIQVARKVVTDTEGLAVPSGEIGRHPEVTRAEAVQLKRRDSQRVLTDEVLVERAKSQVTFDPRERGPGLRVPATSNVDAVAMDSQGRILSFNQRIRVGLAVEPDDQLLVVPAQLDAGVLHRGGWVGAVVEKVGVARLRAMDDLGEAVVPGLRFQDVFVEGERRRRYGEEHGGEQGPFSLDVERGDAGGVEPDVWFGREQRTVGGAGGEGDIQPAATLHRNGGRHVQGEPVDETETLGETRL